MSSTGKSNCRLTALTDALKKGLLGRNVCKVVQAPFPGHYEVQLPEMEGIKRILELARDTPYYAVLHFISHTGVRRAEALALSWQDVDLERGFVSITRTLQRIAREGLVFETTKSRAGRRAIDLDPGTVGVLRAHQGLQMLQRMRLGETWNEPDLVFPGPNGALDPATLTRNWEKLARKAGCPGLRLHDLRHAHAAGLARAGVHSLTIQQRLGHANAAFTMDVYGHVGVGMQAQAANAFANLFGEVVISNSLAKPREKAPGINQEP